MIPSFVSSFRYQLVAMYQTAQQAGTGQTVMTQVQLQPGHHPQPTGAAQQIMTANGQLIQVLVTNKINFHKKLSENFVMNCFVLHSSPIYDECQTQSA